MRLDHKKPLTPIIKGLLIISILALSSLLTQSKVKAQDFGGGFDTGFAAPGTSKKSVGLGISMSTKHQEEGIEPAGINNEIYFNWNSFRVGYNILQAGYNFTKYEKKYQATIDTQAVYTAYVFSTREQNSPFDFYVLGGMSYLMSILTVEAANYSEPFNSVGYVAGFGMAYYFGDFAIAPQYIFLSGKAKFGDVTTAVGSMQSQLTVKAEF